MKVNKLAVILLLVATVMGCTANSPREEEQNQAYVAYSRLGFEYLQAGDLVNAKQSFQRSLAIKSSYAEAHNGLALAFQLEGDKSLAEDYFRKATRLAPESAMMHNNFGAFLFAEKRYQEACVELSRATQDPFYNRRSQAFENLGRCYRLISRDDAAKNAFERSLQVSPNRPIALIELADINFKFHDTVAAEQQFDRFLALVDERKIEHFPKSLWLGIRLARQKGDSIRSATYALILKNLFPDSPEYKAYEESAR